MGWCVGGCDFRASVLESVVERGGASRSLSLSCPSHPGVPPSRRLGRAGGTVAIHAYNLILRIFDQKVANSPHRSLANFPSRFNELPGRVLSFYRSPPSVSASRHRIWCAWCSWSRHFNRTFVNWPFRSYVNFIAFFNYLADMWFPHFVLFHVSNKAHASVCLVPVGWILSGKLPFVAFRSHTNFIAFF